MNTTARRYRVVFSGHTRNGFEPAQVRTTLAQALGLNSAQVQRLFADGARHTLKRTASREEAQRYVLRLARMGAIASVESEAAAPPPAKVKKPAVKAAGKASAPPKAVAAKPARKPSPLPTYVPLSSNLLLRPLLHLAAGLEVAFTLLYALFLLLLASGVFYYSLFTLWASAIVSNPLLAMPLQLLCFILGAIALALLAKPLLSLTGIHHRGINLSPHQEQDIYLFVEDLCQRQALPVPQEIRLGNDSGVQFKHRRGLLGFQRGETSLILGTPLLATASTNQLAAAIVQASELFRPSCAPRSGFIVLAANRWMHRAVYGEDALDRGLLRWRDEGRISDGLVSALQRLFSFSRRLMQLRLSISRGVERRLVHRLVSDADGRATALAGNKGFGEFVESQRLIEHALATLQPELRQHWNNKGTLPQDLIQQLLQHLRSYPAALHGRLSAEQERIKADTADIFPSDAQRLQAHSAAQREPEYNCLSPAMTLLHYFPKLVLTMSLRFYHNRLGIPVTPDKLIRVLPRGSAEAEHEQRTRHFFNGLWQPPTPLKLGLALQGLEDAATARNSWQQAGRKIEQAKNTAHADLQRLHEIEAEMIDGSSRELLYKSEMWRELGESKPRKDELEAFYEECRHREGDHEVALQKVREQLKPYSQRLSAALSLLPHTVENGEQLLREARQLVAVNDRIDAAHSALRELQLHTRLLQVLLSYRRDHKQARLDDRVAEQTSDINQRLTTIGVALKEVATPFSAPLGGEKLMDYLLLEAYQDETPEGDFDRGNDVVERLSRLQKRLLARLIELAQQTEQTLAD